jgi:MFS family permease
VPAVLGAGILCLGSGGSLAVILVGRALVGFGHGLGMLAGLTAILRYHGGPRLAAALNSVELSAMLGILAGIAVLGALPASLPWNLAYLVTSAPLLLGAALAPWLAAAVPAARSLAATPVGPAPAAARPAGDGRALLVLAFVTGSVMSLAYSTVESLLLPIRGSREFGLERAGIARLLQISQFCDILALLPVGMLADRRGARRILGVVALTMAAGTLLVGLGTLPMAVAGCALFGLAMAGWMLPLSLLRAATPPERLPWRTSLYRVGVDAAMFLGPFVSGLLGIAVAAWLAGAFALVLAATGVVLLSRRGS